MNRASGGTAKGAQDVNVSVAVQAAKATRDVEAAWQLGNGLLDCPPVELVSLLEPAMQLCVNTLETGAQPLTVWSVK